VNRRKKILVNQYETATDEALRRSANKNKVRAYTKVRIADALEIKQSGLTDREYEYALKAHFDFILEGADGVDFAVEFDEPHHFTDLDTKRRDQLKNSICEKLELPLVRIDDEYLKRIGHFATVLEWIVDAWYMEQSWEESQDKGLISDDEDFYPFGVTEIGYIENNVFTPVDMNNPKKLEELFNTGRLTSRYYDPFGQYSLQLLQLAKTGICLNGVPELISHIDETTDYSTTIAVVRIPNHRYVVGNGRCRSSGFASIGSELSEYLAIVDVTRQVLCYQNSVFTGYSKHELDLILEKYR
jgi:hypothetical protein